MQRPDEKKRQLIAATAARLFATRPFHKVKLDDVAAEAGVGKGTLYIYFKSKDELYFWLLYDSFSRLVDELSAEVGGGNYAGAEALRRLVAGLVKFGFENPVLFELARAAGPVTRDPRWESKRQELVDLIAAAIRKGYAEGTFDDPHPEVTALCVPGLMRSVMLFGPKGLDRGMVTEQLVRFVELGVGGKGSAKRDVGSGKREVRSEKPDVRSEKRKRGEREAVMLTGRNGGR
jgi:AcrR family transcriptional regulator